MVADVTIGFVKDAKHHIDVQGFNVYHKNRLIKVLFFLWNIDLEERHFAILTFPSISSAKLHFSGILCHKTMRSRSSLRKIHLY